MLEIITSLYSDILSHLIRPEIFDSLDLSFTRSLNDFYELLSENRDTGVTLRAIVQLQLQLQQSTEQLTSQENTGIDCSEIRFSEVANKMSSIQIDDNVNATETVADAIKSIIYRNNDDNLVAAVKVTRSDKEGINEENVPWSYTTAGPQVVEEKEEEKGNERKDEKEDIGMHVSCMPIDLLQHSKVLKALIHIPSIRFSMHPLSRSNSFCFLFRDGVIRILFFRSRICLQTGEWMFIGLIWTEYSYSVKR